VRRLTTTRRQIILEKKKTGISDQQKRGTKRAGTFGLSRKEKKRQEDDEIAEQ